MKHLFAFAFVMLGCLGGYAQPGWDKIPVNASRGGGQTPDDPSKPYQDKDYDYGSESNPSPRNNAVTWADPNGYLWVFGGTGLDQNYQSGIFRDMWKYDPSANSWELIKGNSNQSLFAAEQKTDTQLPLPRKDAASWIDNKGALWLYGGNSLIDLSHLDDMWRFDPGQNEWAKISGTEKANVKPNYGTVKQSLGSSTPGSRSSPASWTDTEGNLWLFGGVSYQSEDNGTESYYNDLWKFNTTTRQWSWIGGSNKANQITATAVKNQSISFPSPSPRSKSACWFDEKSGMVYLYGGFGYDSTATHQGGLSDMWSYSIKSGLWTLKSKSLILNADVDVSYTGSPDNSPGFRISPLYWTNEPGVFYLTGGHNVWGDVTFVDTRLWKFTVQDNIWAVIPIQSKTGIIGSGASFRDNRGDTYIFGGQELDPKLYISRPTNSVWKLSL